MKAKDIKVGDQVIFKWKSGCPYSIDEMKRYSITKIPLTITSITASNVYAIASGSDTEYSYEPGDLVPYVEKFEVGDIITGKKESDSLYRVTNSKGKYEVEKIYEKEGYIRVRVVEHSNRPDKVRGAATVRPQDFIKCARFKVGDEVLFNHTDACRYCSPSMKHYSEKRIPLIITEVMDLKRVEARELDNPKSPKFTYRTKDLVPYEEIFTGSNLKSYKHKYFLGYINENVELNNNYQKTEVCDVKWLSYDNCISTIRPYNIEKKNILKKINSVLQKYRLYS